MPVFGLVAVAFGVLGDFAAEEPVDDAEVHKGEEHAEAPPDEAYVEGVGAGYCGGYGEVVAGVTYGGKKHGEEAEAGADHHGGEVEAGTQEGLEARAGGKAGAHEGETGDDA